MPKASKNPRAKLHSKAAASVKATKEDQTTAAAPVSVPVSEPAEVPAAAPITGGGKKARYAGVESKIPALKAQYLQTSAHPYSRSHMRRIKRRAKEDLSGGSLAAVQEALLGTLTTDGDDDDDVGAAQEESGMVEDDHEDDEAAGHQGRRKRRRGKGGNVHSPVVSNAGFTMIGQGTGKTLKPKQRQQEILKARARVGAVIANPVFQSNPFAAIREHAGNTLVKHQADL